MLDLSQVKHHRSIEEIAQVLCNRTRRNDPAIFRVIIAYYLCMVASTMRAKINIPGRGDIPVNCYAIALAPSGFGKGASTGAIEDMILQPFRETFLDHVLPVRAEQNLWKQAMRRAAISGNEEQEEYDNLLKEFNSCGEYPFVFDGGSEPAIKQVRQLLLLADCGSINLQVDEIGSNLAKASTTEALNVYLELYDKGRVKDKLTKNSSENKRGKQLIGCTPANALLFGTGNKLLDAGAVEKQFISFLDTGYARRSIFAYGKADAVMDDKGITAEEVFDLQIDPQNDKIMQAWAMKLATLADPSKLEWTVEIGRKVGVAYTDYRMKCEEAARQLPEHAEILRTELMHRYFKVLKIAGAFAFIDESMTMTMDHLNSAIKLVEESGAALKEVLSREGPYIKLAKFLASAGKEVTHAELLDELPFYKAGNAARQEMMTLATAWGYKNHIIIKKTYVDNVELFTGESLKETSLDALRLSWSEDWAYNYQPEEEVPFDQLPVLTQANNLHWANHHFQRGHRCEEAVIKGFNLVVLDIDGTSSLQTAHELLADYVFMTHTTKRHTPEQNRFRLILPMNYHLELDSDDYRLFMQSLTNWLPFPGIDEQASQRSRKWASHDGTFHMNTNGKLLDVLPFVPKTSKNEQHQKEFAELASLDNLERWFAQRFAEGNRNNQMIRFAYALVDAGMDYPSIEQKVLSFNEKLANGLSADELRATVLVSVARKLQGMS